MLLLLRISSGEADTLVGYGVIPVSGVWTMGIGHSGRVVATFLLTCLGRL